jgi:hypothetical protein
MLIFYPTTIILLPVFVIRKEKIFNTINKLSKRFTTLRICNDNGNANTKIDAETENILKYTM